MSCKPPSSLAEQKAAEAQALPAFRNLNLYGIKTAIEQILALVGRDGIFREYTLHDIAHVDEMLSILDWLVPTTTQDVMTPADWLLIVLSVYFHDVGLVVTQQEFVARADSEFDSFCSLELFEGQVGAEYRAKLTQMGEEAAERFAYEEFIRRHHAERVADWIQAKHSPRRGISLALAEQIDELLKPLPTEFRRDLALVCESHHRSDLYRTSKYKLSQPYGNSDAETANVQYAALLLRSADLLHITSDRTPSVMFRLINPQDPVSQREWSKQRAVRRVRPQKGLDLDGNRSDAAPKSTVEVFATFADANGFFGLTSYLRYAEGQLLQTFQWAEASRTQAGLAYAFPWRRIDDTEVTATGFLPERLGFSLDQDKILELLTGHTLYNDTSVVIRELVQNALDATRLQAHVDGRRPSEQNVHVSWDEDARVLTITDDGVGMSQQVIERNLLKAGASRYQEESFRKEHPDFTPISRFGIGVLSAFMVADSVEITTCSPVDAEARQLTLRSVHGRYLVELLDKESDDRARGLVPHGTEVKLHVRSSADMPDVLETLWRWTVVPECSVTAHVSGGEETTIGYKSPSEALGAVLEAQGQSVSFDGTDSGAIRVVEAQDDGLNIAYALRWSPFFREWAFVLAPDHSSHDDLRLGTCIAGIRVEDDTPGFDGLNIMAIANAYGSNAPRTNVARSGLEVTSQRDDLLRRIYRAYLSHVASEAAALHESRGMSLTWSAQEVDVLLRPLRDPEVRARYTSARRTPAPLSEKVLEAELRRHPLILIEHGGARRLESGDALANENLVWTVDSAFVRAAERLLREVPTEASLSSLATGFNMSAFDLPDEPTMVGYKGYDADVPEIVLRHRDVGKVVIRRDERRIDLGWVPKASEPRWVDPASSFGLSAESEGRVRIARTDPVLVGADGETAIRAHGVMYLFAHTPVAQYLVKASGAVSTFEEWDVLQLLTALTMHYIQSYSAPKSAREFVADFTQMDSGRLPSRSSVPGEFIASLESTPRRVFDTSVWSRSDER